MLGAGAGSILMMNPFSGELDPTEPMIAGELDPRTADPLIYTYVIFKRKKIRIKVNSL